MTYVGIDVAKDKHDCYIVNSDGEILAEAFTIPNDQIGFNLLFQTLQSVAPDLSKVKVGRSRKGTDCVNSICTKYPSRFQFREGLLLT